jgi:hypothetical protein
MQQNLPGKQDAAMENVVGLRSSEKQLENRTLGDKVLLRGFEPLSRA